METSLSAIRGLRVVDALFVEGDAGISFDNGASLAICNKFSLLGEADGFIGQRVVSVDEDADIVLIRFESGASLRVDMRDEAYTGPEAMQLRIPGKPIVIWNWRGRMR